MPNPFLFLCTSGGMCTMYRHKQKIFLHMSLKRFASYLQIVGDNFSKMPRAMRRYAQKNQPC